MHYLAYSETYSSLAKKPTGPLSEEQARQRNSSGEPFTVTLGDPSSPDAAIEVDWENDHIGVWFYDDQVRPTVNFSFSPKKDRLFLESITNWKYPEGASLMSQANLIEEVSYTTAGIIRHQIEDKEAGQRTVRDLSDVDVTQNWEPVPEFGNWGSLARFDRE